MARYCQKCHGGDEPKGELKLDAYLSRAAIVEDRETWEKIAQKLHDREMPPEDQPQPTDAEHAAVTRWIDGSLAAHECGGQRDPGRVTLRRLNRNEYNNTIRDLIGIDFHPADDFPSDDVGYGFDNIGDVLSMPPLLLEKYLTAASQIVERALGTDQVNLVTGEISGGQLLGEGARILTSEVEVRTKVRSAGQGDYRLRVRAYGEQAGDEPVRMGLYLDNKLVRTFDVKAIEGRPQLYEAWAAIEHGQHTYSIVFLNDYYRPDAPPPNDRNLVISDLEVMGPYPDAYKQIIPREHTPDDKMLLAREMVNAFMTRAFRRPSTAAEVDRVLKLVEMADNEGEDFATAIGLGLQAMLVSPHFLFRVELDPDPSDPPTIRTLNDYELATRLSYFLWSSMPDDELFAHARQGTLRKGDTLASQVRRMLNDDRAAALVDNFAGQWLQLRNLKIVAPDKIRIPDVRRAAAGGDAQRDGDVLRHRDARRPQRARLHRRRFHVRQRAAGRHYGIADVEGDEFRRVQLDGRAARRRADAGQRADGHVEPHAHLPGQTRQMGAGESAGHATPASARRRAAAERRSAPRHWGARCASGCSTIARRPIVPCATIAWIRWASDWRTTTASAPGAPNDGTFAIDASGTLPDGQSFAGPQRAESHSASARRTTSSAAWPRRC